MNFSHAIALTAAGLVFFLAVPAASAFWKEPTFDNVVEALAGDLVASGKLKGEAVLVNPQDLFDAQTRLSHPFANQLRNRLVTELTNSGARVLLPGADESLLLLQGTWTRRGDALAIDLKVLALGAEGPEVRGAASANLPLRLVDPESLTPDRDSWARYLIRQLGQNLRWQSSRAVYLPPFRSGGQRGSSELGPYLAGWLRPALAESGIFRPIDPRDALGAVTVPTLRTRGLRTRGIYPQVPAGSEPSLTANLVNADAELKGEIWLHGSKVELRATLIDPQGQQLSAATVEVPADLFPASLFIPDPLPVDAPLTAAQLTSTCVASNGLRLELTSTRGESRPAYRKGEQIRFLLRLNRPAWIYLFDMNPAGEAILLYPVDGRGRLAREDGFLREIDKPLVLPEDGYSYDLIVDAPFGTDIVWAVASETPLEFPPDLGGDWSRAENLVLRLREQGTKGQKGYAEGRLELVTAER